MKLQSTRFGEVDYTPDDTITFRGGLVGFNKDQEFVLINNQPESPFRWLQSTTEPELAFLLADPDRYLTNYSPKISADDAKSIGLGDETPHLLYVTANIPHGKPREMTLNLAGPIVINIANRSAKQLVLEDQAYTIRHKVFEVVENATEKAIA